MKYPYPYRNIEKKSDCGRNTVANYLLIDVLKCMLREGGGERKQKAI